MSTGVDPIGARVRRLPLPRAPRPATDSVRLRAMVAADIPVVSTITWEAFGIPLDSVQLKPTWDARMAMMLRTDPEGAFVALAEDDQVIGGAAAIARGELWVLSLLSVNPHIQSRGTGRALMEAALGYRPELENRLIMSTNDPRAMRLYWQAGFELHPAMAATGSLDPARVPALDQRITAVPAAQIPELAPISLALRGGDSTEELKMITSVGGRLFRLDDRGFVAISANHEVWLLAALDEESAKALLWHGLVNAAAGGAVRVRYISGANQWALNILMEAGLDLKADGAVSVAGKPGPLYPYIPSGPLS